MMVSKNSILKTLLSSFAVLGLGMFLAVDAGFRIADKNLHLTDPHNSPIRSLIWWTAKGYLAEPKAPDIVLLGSSLMMTAHHAGDATKRNEIVNEVKHFHSTCMEDFLAQKGGQKPSAFSFAIAGQMASDAYLIARSLLVGDKQPKVIVYGIAPRDLIDNTLPSPASTETFRYLDRFSDFSDIALSARTSANEFIQYGLEKAIYTLSHRPDLICLQHKFAYSLAPFGKDAHTDAQIKTPFALRAIARMDVPDDNGANELRIGPYDKATEPFRDNTTEYRHRYAYIKQKTYKSQLSYLNKLMSLCKQQGIQLVVVNMPLTPGNVSLMAPGFYDQYKSTVAAMARENGAGFLDMNKQDAFEQKHFADTVHLNGLGGVQFFKLLSDELALDRSFTAALSATQ
ncbi:MAG: hypothetical protein C0507_02785 [Cyanobacteria bacterium PR.3.49]|nr:hypothetical protein [Cyanobacteria bacterium PR.3.49]